MMAYIENNKEQMIKYISKQTGIDISKIREGFEKIEPIISDKVIGTHEKMYEGVKGEIKRVMIWQAKI